MCACNRVFGFVVRSCGRLFVLCATHKNTHTHTLRLTLPTAAGRGAAAAAGGASVEGRGVPQAEEVFVPAWFCFVLFCFGFGDGGGLRMGCGG